MSDLELYNQFAEDAMLNKKHSPWLTNKEIKHRFCEAEIIECNDPYWYKNYIGVKFMACLTMIEEGKVRTISACQLSGKMKFIKGREFKPSDIQIL